MSNVEYDIEKLKRFGEINPESALKGFDSSQEYFDCLTKFSESYEEYLTKHSEYRIINRNEARMGFMQELKKLREFFLPLGMEEAVLDIKYLEQAALGRDEDALAHELAEFRNRMKKISGIIQSARLDDQPLESHQTKDIILAVDDMPGLLSATVKMLKDKYTVIAVTSAQAALKALEKQTPSLFLLDIEMPVMNGYELAREIRAIRRFAETPILFLTALNTRDDVISAIKHGGNDYIVKPVDKDLLISKIRRFLSDPV